MLGSSGSPRQNACKACTRTKRACDRNFPRCGRCADKLIECQYFRKFVRTRPVLLAPRTEGRIHTDTHIIHGKEAPHVHKLHTQEEPGLHPLIHQSRLTRVPPRVQIHDINPPALAWPEVSFQPSQIPRSIFVPTPHYKNQALSPNSLLQYGWFLHPDSWEVKRTYIASPPDPQIVFKVFVNTVRGWLRDFATTGHNIFIHQRLYRSPGGGMPLCMQDAWLTLTAYLTKSDQTEDMILQILEERARGLLYMEDPSKAMDVRTHLARTHALLIYTLIRLFFDNPPLQRAQAVDALPVLSMWCQQLRETAIGEAPNLFQADFSTSDANSFINGHEIEQTSFWHAFIISESIRRTWMLVSATLRIFQPWPAAGNDQNCLDLSTVTQNRCLGFLSFTIRAGLWEAKSASEWADLHNSGCGGPRPAGSDHGYGQEEADQHNIPTDGQLWEGCTNTVITTFIQDATGTDPSTGIGGGLSMSVTPIFLESVGIVDKVVEETRPEDVDEWTNQIFRMGLAGEKINAWDRKSRSRVFAG